MTTETEDWPDELVGLIYAGHGEHLDEVKPAKLMHWCHGFECCGVPWPAGELDVGVPHPRNCLSDPITWPGEAARPGELVAFCRDDGHVEVRNPGGRVLSVSTWTMGPSHRGGCT